MTTLAHAHLLRRFNLFSFDFRWRHFLNDLKDKSHIDCVTSWLFFYFVFWISFIGSLAEGGKSKWHSFFLFVSLLIIWWTHESCVVTLLVLIWMLKMVNNVCSTMIECVSVCVMCITLPPETYWAIWIEKLSWSKTRRLPVSVRTRARPIQIQIKRLDMNKTSNTQCASSRTQSVRHQSNEIN